MSPSSGLRESLSTRLAARRVVADMSAKLENTTDEVCVIFHRLGPYHRARLDAAAKRMPIVALELAAESDTYAWSRVEDSPDFRRVTLKPGEGVAAALEKIRPRIVAIPGWARPQAIDALMHCARTKTPSIMMSESQWNDAPRHLLAERVKVELLKACSAAFVLGLIRRTFRLSRQEPRKRAESPDPSSGFGVLRQFSHCRTQRRCPLALGLQCFKLTPDDLSTADRGYGFPFQFPAMKG